MTTIGTRIALILMAIFATAVVATPASAQATRTWISGVGDDANPCSRTAPCKTFQGAISKTATGGEINCLDPGGFGGVTITKSISLICDNTETGVLVAGTNAIIVNAANAIVVISGFDIEGLGQTGSSGVNGIRVLNAAAVHVRNTKIRGFRNGYGIDFSPAAGNAKLTVTNTDISESGGTPNPTSSGGVLVNPQGTATAKVSLKNVTLANNLNIGVRVDTTGNTAPGTGIVVTVDDSTLSGNGNGLSLINPPSTTRAQVVINSSVINYNDGFGIGANGGFAQIRVNETLITGNTTGLQIGGGASILSYGTNLLFGNGTDGTFSSTLPRL